MHLLKTLALLSSISLASAQVGDWIAWCKTGTAEGDPRATDECTVTTNKDTNTDFDPNKCNAIPEGYGLDGSSWRMLMYTWKCQAFTDAECKEGDTGLLNEAYYLNRDYKSFKCAPNKEDTYQVSWCNTPKLPADPRLDPCLIISPIVKSKCYTVPNGKGRKGTSWTAQGTNNNCELWTDKDCKKDGTKAQSLMEDLDRDYGSYKCGSW